jgi:hypothetical protein
LCFITRAAHPRASIGGDAGSVRLESLCEVSEFSRLLSDEDTFQAGLPDVLPGFFRQPPGLLRRRSLLRCEGFQPAIILQDRADPVGTLCRTALQHALEFSHHEGGVVSDAPDPHGDGSSLLQPAMSPRIAPGQQDDCDDANSQTLSDSKQRIHHVQNLCRIGD